MALPAVLRHRDFNLYWFGVVFSQIGTRGTVAANLYHIYQLTGSTLQTGLVGLFQAIALLVLSPIGGAYADRMDRRRLLQVTQLGALLVALGLALLTYADAVRPWHILVSVLLTTAAATFDQPARQALIPAMVPREELVQAFALLNPSRELAILVGPALAGVLIAISSPGLMYAVDAATYGFLVVILAVLHVPSLVKPENKPPLVAAIREGVTFVRHRPIIWQLMTLDLSATLFGAYRVVLPALAIDVLNVGPSGYGILAAAPSAGALLATFVVFKLVKSASSGHIVLASTIAYGAAVVAFAQAPVFAVALAFAVMLGLFDALATTVRHAAVQLETPDVIRGRVSSIYQMASRGGPALGDLNIGWWAAALGPVTALTLGGMVPIAYATALVARGGRIKDYALAGQQA